MDKFKNKFRIPSARASWWDYANDGAYFITICTANRQHFFGEISKPKQGEIAFLHTTEIGKMAEQYWYEIPNHFSYIKLGAFIVMPNHIHGILILENEAKDEKEKILEPQKGGCTGDKNPMLSENISKVVRWYKGRCTYEMRKIDMDFEWQSRFYDHIIKNRKAYSNISNYIKNNPQKWKEDCFNYEF